jgi:hypothetical protein
MARFRGTVKGGRSKPISRLGHAGSGLVVEANGWDNGVRVYVVDKDGVDRFVVYLTGGSNDAKEYKRIYDSERAEPAGRV